MERTSPNYKSVIKGEMETRNVTRSYLSFESGPGLAGYAAWKLEMSLEAWPSLEASIHEVSSSVPS